MTPTTAPHEKISTSLKVTTISLLTAWTLVVAFSLVWNLSDLHNATNELGRSTARVVHEMDVAYRLWNAKQGGVYAAVDSTTLPNQYLQGVQDRDISTPGGKALTLVNPAYMTRQVHELLATQSGVQGHITSLKPIRAENKADDWESAALRAFETGSDETTIVEQINGQECMRLMRPLLTEQACLQCHAVQGYKVGDVRGGISVAVPMAPLRAVEASRATALMLAHFGLWLLGFSGILFLWKLLAASELKRNLVLAEREQAIVHLNEALASVKTLSGLIPICAGCKRVRDDSGYWNQVEAYVSQHTDAKFSHGLCPACVRKIYPEYAKVLDKEEA